ncbi:6-phosphogluconolactonase [Parerythrobacter jejuensis]|uniref:6-phosphogluconolactonase n=1 Tax=Parerythrobacter jejuensis TaxID=795812 RepID=A0A845ANE6_9SPHN|nr:6-phosphogluconolactonase [Parerythrobacter jejuensis]MXP30371.1 6-phosphogluconolactonase [Parerythrobacter jejuensis]MXP33131.1 6-phosphogluconolactonase [Parerythrobacter jejuensis]
MDDLTLYENADARRIADWLHTQLADSLTHTEGSIAITIPGGSTPFPILEDLVARDLDWSRIAVWPNDDRIVPEDHPASNTGKMRKLFEPAGAEVVTLTVMERVPPFALTWLGMGADGHIASLFPNTDPKVSDPEPIRRITPDPLPPEAPFDRITLTLPSLLASGTILFTLGGSAEKRAVFMAASHGDHDLPVARLLAATSQPVTCFT